ncbi:MAG TPA: DUF4097 family beta strand repeat-containing protein [Anaerolineaceae bacterium]|nr:DUF4097 family beta strand repeat-containing protein [Anaerolineaceae bacterium]
MTKIQQTWPVEAFDSIQILAYEWELNLLATEGDQVILESEESSFTPADRILEVNQGWLQMGMMEDHGGHSKFDLRLPQRKPWTVEVSTWKGKIEVHNLELRLNAALGKGELYATNCQGQFSISGGDGKVVLENCSEKEMPSRQNPPEFEAMSNPFENPSPQDPARDSWDWFDWSSRDWSDWGQRFSSQARVWGLKFGRMFAPMGRMVPNAGISIQLAKGDVTVERIHADSCSVAISRGNLKIQHGTVKDLALTNSHGDIECSAVLPAGSWEFQSNHGDLRIDLPADAQARIDAATRNGDIRSDIPLVRVPRPGPESRRGARMVGTVGQSRGEGAQISLLSNHGQIKIGLLKTASEYSARPEPPQEVEKTIEPIAEGVAVEADRPEVHHEPGQTAGRTERAPENALHQSQLLILQALRDGAISVEEAERLLNSL